jgi:hypothetical protein
VPKKTIDRRLNRGAERAFRPVAEDRGFDAIRRRKTGDFRNDDFPE